MKQYTDAIQTAKLIMLGFEKPKSRIDGEIEEILKVIVPLGEFKIPISNNGPAYSIGELIEMLPEVLAPSNNDDWEMPLSISTDSFMWTVEYDGGCFSPYETSSVELIDALCDMLIKLKEEEVI